jgi:hypothetical protein
MDATFDATACREVCFELDGVTTGDAGIVADDGGMGMRVASSFATSASVSCAWIDATTVQCSYQGATQCSGGSGCIIPPCAIAGRAPSALVDARPLRARHDVAAWLAETARLEAASVDAFEDLVLELGLHDAPRSLARAARASAGDERRHAATVASLARRVGAAPAPVVRSDHAPRSLFDVARDNAAEGCVREAFGAIVATLQAQRTESASIRRAFAEIARDEARHALFSLDLDDWARTRLTPTERTRLADARREAVHGLARELDAETAPSLRTALGLPDATRANDLLALVA